MTNSRISKSYPKHFETNPEKCHTAYERSQMKRHGNFIIEEEDEAEELENRYDILNDFSQQD